ncbi:MAG: HDOD domain-containing protein [Deltaproteobacteria bacterium]|nr:HDOD domain-containing protein [Deltaproteobacteria bacterium]
MRATTPITLLMNGALATAPPSVGVQPCALLRGALATRLERGDVELPLPPRVATEVLALTRDDTADIGRLGKLLHQDPALAGHVLRIANSPAYLPRSPIVSLQQAVTHLGFTLLSEIALVASMQSGVFKLRGYESELRDIWQHALASGGFAREIARKLRSNVESAFLCGLMHTIGKPLVLQTVVNESGKLGVAASRDDVRQLIDQFHIPAGGLLAKRWALPGAVCDAISSYASYTSGTAGPREPVITALADRLAFHLVDKETDETALRAHRSWVDLNLYPEDAEDILGRTDTVRGLVESMLL